MFDTYYGRYRTNLFCEVFPNKEEFRAKYLEVGLGGFKNDSMIYQLYYLLYARRGNDAVLSSDQNRFIYALFATVFKYGPEYEKKYEIQQRILSLTDEELERGTTSINNFAENPSTAPSTQEFEQLKKINSQSATGYKRSKVDALTLQREALDSSYVEEFLKRFDKLFSPFPAEIPLIYTIEGDEEDD